MKKISLLSKSLQAVIKSNGLLMNDSQDRLLLKTLKWQIDPSLLLFAFSIEPFRFQPLINIQLDDNPL